MQEGLYNLILLYTIARDELIPWPVSLFRFEAFTGVLETSWEEQERKDKKNTGLKKQA